MSGPDPSDARSREDFVELLRAVRKRKKFKEGATADDRSVSRTTMHNVGTGRTVTADGLEAYLLGYGVPLADHAPWQAKREQLYGHGRKPAPEIRSAYRENVARIAPFRLLHRESELAELDEFCRQPGTGSYFWWQAGPWAGKSALLSTFVLSAPHRLADAASVVSFFITARLAQQDTVGAFTSALTEQLCALLRRDPPAALTEAARETAMLGLLADAVAACQAAGRRLILVVDGLDEDRGVLLGPYAHSIAALLPGHPWPGLRVIVSSRRNPPLPDDVPGWHPLRDPAVVRSLSEWQNAIENRRAARSELRRLLQGSGVEQDLLGLLTTAQGGLSGTDLRDLTGTDLAGVEDVLHTVAGRTFTSRSAAWPDGVEPEIYLLAHEELQAAAERYLGPERLSGYRSRLHSWAGRYSAEPAWPLDTPRYLLTGYPRMLARSGDLGRLVELATDGARHDCMLSLSGGDAAALAEVKAAADTLLKAPVADLAALTRLAIHRSELVTRNAEIPRGLPAVWVALGESDRALSLARGVADPERRQALLAGLAHAAAVRGELDLAEGVIGEIEDRSNRAAALAEVAGVIAAAGDDRAGRLAAEAEEVARAVVDPWQKRRVLLTRARAAAASGDREQARQREREARQVPQDIQETFELDGLIVAHVRTLADIGELDEAEAGVQGVRPRWRTIGLTRIASAFALRGDRDQARRVAELAEQAAREVPHPFQQPHAWAETARALVAAGELARARQVAARAETIAATLTEPDRLAWALADLAGALAAAGDPAGSRRLAIEAERTARGIVDRKRRAQDLAELTRAADLAGNRDDARQLAAEAAKVARGVDSLFHRKEALTVAAEALVASGEVSAAEKLVRECDDPADQAELLARLARVLAERGEPETARRLAVEAEETGHLRANIVRAVAAIGDLARAEKLASDLEPPQERAGLVTHLARAAAAGDDPQKARTLLAAGLTAVREMSQENELTAAALVEIADVTAEVGDLDAAKQIAGEAEQIARRIKSNEYQEIGLSHAVRGWAAAGDLDQAELVAREITRPVHHGAALIVLARAVALAGEPERAELLAMEIADPEQQALALTRIAEVVGPPAARLLLARALVAGRWTDVLPVLARLFPLQVPVLAGAGGAWP